MLVALGMSVGREGPAGWCWLCSPALTAPSPAGADAGRWRQHWVPLPPVAVPCVSGEEGWESHRLCLQQLLLLPAHHLCPGPKRDALPVSPSVCTRRDRLSHQPPNTGETCNKATLDSHCLPGGSWQQVRLCLHHCSGSILTEQLWSLALVLAWPEEHLLPLHMRLLLASSCRGKGKQIKYKSQR